MGQTSESLFVCICVHEFFCFFPEGRERHFCVQETWKEIRGKWKGQVVSTAWQGLNSMEKAAQAERERSILYDALIPSSSSSLKTQVTTV